MSISEEQKRKNLQSVLRKASKLIKQDKDKAIEAGDFELSLGISSRESRFQSYLKRQGIDYEPTE